MFLYAKVSKKENIGAFIAISKSVFIYEPEHEKKLSSGFLTRSDTNQTVQPQKMSRPLKFWIKEVEVLFYRTAKLICVSVFLICKKSFFS